MLLHLALLFPLGTCTTIVLIPHLKQLSIQISYKHYVSQTLAGLFKHRNSSEFLQAYCQITRIIPLLGLSINTINKIAYY